MEDGARKPPVSGIALDVVVFVCGAVVMTYEIIGSRILSPFIGTSTYVWTSLIGVILAALSTGYWLGGKMADRRPEAKILAGVIFIAGGLVSFTIVAKEIVLSAIAAANVGLELKSVLAAIILFAPASIALGFVTPFAVKLRMSSLGEAGVTVGRLYALSTVGSIVGTFAAGFILIPFVGSVRTLYLIAASLFLVSLLLVPFALTRVNTGILLLFILGISTSEISRYGMLYAYGLHDIDTEYSRVQVFRSTDRRTNRPIQALSFDPYSTQSAMFMDSDELVFEYTKFYHLAKVLKPDLRRTLMIGGAG
jgi:predicted membrane-bound spermidine synthase